MHTSMNTRGKEGKSTVTIEEIFYNYLRNELLKQPLNKYRKCAPKGTRPHCGRRCAACFVQQTCSQTADVPLIPQPRDSFSMHYRRLLFEETLEGPLPKANYWYYTQLPV